MTLILPGIFTLVQHFTILKTDPESYRPDRCSCGHTRVWCHGCYTRKPDRKDLGEPCLNPVLIPRFYCPECGCTCSRLPECIPPRSWYLWEVRQVIFLLLLAGNTLGRTAASNGSRVSRTTIKRWWRRLHDRHETFSLNLLPHFPCMGRHARFTDFWQTWLTLRPLSSAMTMLHLEGVVVP
ncbi:MAG TPA: hypothetical protein VN648_30790 [Candidatus Methylomirabilis sp.]|nr:hypothetical protein [Candidatus Methylomirabilis sp.]